MLQYHPCNVIILKQKIGIKIKNPNPLLYSNTCEVLKKEAMIVRTETEVETIGNHVRSMLKYVVFKVDGDAFSFPSEIIVIVKNICKGASSATWQERMFCI